MSSIPQLFTPEQILDVLSLSENATGIYSGDDMIIQAANDAILKLWGKGKDVIGKPINEAIPELSDQPFKEIYLNVMRTGQTYSSKNMPAELIVNGLRRLYYFDFKYTAIKNKKGETYCVLNTATDVTDRFNIEQAAKEAEQREQSLMEELAASNEELTAMNEELSASNEDLMVSFEDIKFLNQNITKFKNELSFAVEAANLGTWDLDPSTNRFSGNSRLKSWFGLKSEDSIELNHAIDAIVEQDRAAVINAINKALEYSSGGHYDIEYSIYQKEKNETLKVRARGQAFFNEQNEAIRFSGTLQDITKEYQIKEELLNANNGLQLALNAARLGSYELDLVTGKMIISEQCSINFGKAINELFDFDELIKQIRPDFKAYVQQQITEAINAKGTYSVEYPMIWPDETERWIRVSGKPHYDDKGNATKITGVTFDITEQRKDDLLKNDFIAMVSHELKTPLTSIKGYIQIMQHKIGQAQDKSYAIILDKAETQIQKMNAMINGFLSISRLESGKIFLEKEDFDLDKLTYELVEESRLLYPAYQINIVPGPELHVFADREKIGHVISNLVSNAAKYSKPHSTIEVSCFLSPEKDAVLVSVKDEGIGVEPEYIEKIFDRYYRVEGNHTISGFGIGLYLSAEIINRHYGNIGLKSEVNAGSTFWFSLPLTQ